MVGTDAPDQQHIGSKQGKALNGHNRVVAPGKQWCFIRNYKLF
jgi:hypothetical protein